METEMLNWALKYQNMGMSVIPVNRKDKKPFFKWEQYQKERAVPEQIKSWWTQWPDAMIAVVTGPISGIVGIDLDTQEAIDKINELLPDNLTIPAAKTPGGGLHFFFLYSAGLRNSNDGLIHVRAEGGYIVLPPSKRFDGVSYAWVDPSLALDPAMLTEVPAMVLTYIRSKERERSNALYKECTSTSTIWDVDKKEKLSTTVYNFFSFGRRDDDLFHAANVMTKGGAESSFISDVLERLIVSWGENPDKKWIDAKIKSAFERTERKNRNLAEEVRDWICLQAGIFLSTELHKSLRLSTREEEKNLSIILKRLINQGLIEKFGDKRGCYKTINKDLEEIDWENADDTVLKIQMPFQIEEIVELLPKNIAVIAGVANAGKTAFLLNLALMNKDKFPVIYFSSEMDGPELKKRLTKFEGSLKQWKTVKFCKKEEDFVHSLDPDGLNIIDFLELTDKFYLIAERLREYHRKLNKGILFVAIQKDPNKDYGRGGGMGLEKPRLYLTMGKGICTIVKGKNWANDFNPDGLTNRFKLVQGSKFIAEGWKREK